MPDTAPPTASFEPEYILVVTVHGQGMVMRSGIHTLEAAREQRKKLMDEALPLGEQVAVFVRVL